MFAAGVGGSVCLDVHIILPLLAIYKRFVAIKRRETFQCALTGYVDEIVEKCAADVFNFAAVNIGNIGYTGIDITVLQYS